ncbi:uncharacterized protein F4822DRAFT_196662 [Hypoxylon trugodes]|uniref:uncharacterized protein n=1 Tax=Hypoxylon trugodes TaxID=326681 RepID=UPI0021925BE7|nr:uncharacterized protein F4822DRAFT_196662 [Hypoxylon trugodes]KAI1389313.1 hypothetical protein F4822DRAFT_196662 [Hypoxylon trugodes]
MASFISSSPSNSSPTPFEEPDELTLDLQPAPLRLPRRNIPTTFDGAGSVDQDQDQETTSTTENDSSTSACTVRRGSPSLPHQSVIARDLSQRRPPAPKLGSLVSKFENLDAVRNTEAGPSSEAKPSTIPRVQRKSTRQDSQVECPEQVTPMDRGDATRNPEDLSPRQVASPPPLDARSKVPVDTVSKIKARGDEEIDTHASKGVERTLPTQGQVSQNQTLPLRNTKDDGIDHISSRSIPSQKGKHPG